MRHRIELGTEETDIDLVLPGGQVVQLQYRLGSPSLELCLPEPTSVTNWVEEMEPGPVASGNGDHVRLASQVVIDLNPAWVEAGPGSCPRCDETEKLAALPRLVRVLTTVNH